MSPSNRAAWLVKPKAGLEVGPAPYTAPGENEIVVKNRAIAVNPVEWSKQVVGDLMFSWIKYPFVLGNDLAGDVVEVGTGFGPGRFKPGDRIVGHAVGMDPQVNKSAEGAFQEYTVVRAHMASAIPSSLSYEDACVLPLCLSTAACGLFQQDYLGLKPPIASPPARKPTDETVLVWGGSTSVGSNAIQLAVAAGYDVITTASPRNFDYVKKLGASQAFDYSSNTVVQDIVFSLHGKTVAGAIAVGNNSTEGCINVLAKSSGKRLVAQASFPWPEKVPTSTLGIVGFMIGMIWWNIKVMFISTAKGVKTKFIFGSSLMNNEVSRMVYGDFLSQALTEGSFTPAPEPLVVGKGLENIQEALDLHKQGVSARKVVISLSSSA